MFDGYIGLGLVILAMLAIMILYFVFGNKANAVEEDADNYEAIQDYDEYPDEYDEYEEEVEKGGSLYRDVAESGGYEEHAGRQTEPAFSATFDPNAPAYADEDSLEETTVLSHNDINMQETALGDVSEQTILLPKEELAAATMAAGAAAVAENRIAEDDNNVLLPEKPLPFGYKMAWLAIPHVKSSQVLSALKLEEIAPANWTKGLTVAYDDKKSLFVTPVLKDWVLVIGRALWSKADLSEPVQSNQWLKDISKMFEESYYFSTMRGLENHGWVKMKQGKLVRAYGVSGELGEVMWCYGQPTQAELSVNPNLPAPERLEGNEVFPNEKTVLEIAAKWSINTSFADYEYNADIGFIGKMK